MRSTTVDIEESGIKDTESGAEPDPNARLVEISAVSRFRLPTTIYDIGRITIPGPFDVDLTPVHANVHLETAARIRHEDDGSYGVIEDVGTMNGTFVNGVRLVAGRSVSVVSGDTVVFGTIQCRFEIDQN